MRRFALSIILRRSPSVSRCRVGSWSANLYALCRLFRCCSGRSSSTLRAAFTGLTSSINAVNAAERPSACFGIDGIWYASSAVAAAPLPLPPAPLEPVATFTRLPTAEPMPPLSARVIRRVGDVGVATAAVASASSGRSVGVEDAWSAAVAGGKATAVSRTPPFPSTSRARAFSSMPLSLRPNSDAAIAAADCVNDCRRCCLPARVGAPPPPAPSAAVPPPSLSSPATATLVRPLLRSFRGGMCAEEVGGGGGGDRALTHAPPAPRTPQSAVEQM